MEKVLSYIEKGKKEAHLLTGGKIWKSESTPLDQGYFVEPTIFEAKEENATIVREEIFGPVMTILGFTSEEEVIQDRKSTRLNSSHVAISYAVFCLKKKNQHTIYRQ